MPISLRCFYVIGRHVGGDTSIGKRAINIRLGRLAAWLLAAVAVALALVAGPVWSAQASAMSAPPGPYAYYHAAYGYDVPALLSPPDTVATGARESPERPGAVSRASPVSVVRDFVAANTGGAVSQRLGQVGVNAVRSMFDIGPKATEVINGNARVFDGLTETTVSEVKNVASQSLTQQLRDDIYFAQDTGREFDLFVRPDTYLTQPLQDAIANGDVVLRYIP